MNNNNFCTLSDKFQRVVDKNSVGNTNVLTISAQHGLINQFEYYNHQYASENTSGYTLLNKGDFAYNKSYSDGYPWGATKRLERYDSGIVSPLYICFSAKDGVCADFYSYYFESEPFYREIYKIAQEGARNHGLLNVATEDFFKIRIANPPLEEQRRIAEILGCCDRVIALKKELIAEKKKQKKALMQKLLNPNSGFRLPGFSGEWKSLTLKDICDIRGGKRIPKGEHLLDFDTGYPYITISDMECGTISTKKIKFVPQRVIPKIKKYTISIDDIYFSVAGTLGLVGTIPLELNNANLTENADKLTNIRCNRNFLLHILNSDIIQSQVEYCKTNNAQPKIAIAQLCKFSLNMPLRQEEQQAIADILSAADKEIDLLEQELVQQEQKKKSLMQLLLTGIVRV